MFSTRPSERCGPGGSRFRRRSDHDIAFAFVDLLDPLVDIVFREVDDVGGAGPSRAKALSWALKQSAQDDSPELVA
jgi:hypothetical protein